MVWLWLTPPLANSKVVVCQQSPSSLSCALISYTLNKLCILFYYTNSCTLNKLSILLYYTNSCTLSKLRILLEGKLKCCTSKYALDYPSLVNWPYSFKLATFIQIHTDRDQHASVANPNCRHTTSKLSAGSILEETASNHLFPNTSQKLNKYETVLKPERWSPKAWQETAGQ